MRLILQATLLAIYFTQCTNRLSLGNWHETQLLVFMLNSSFQYSRKRRGCRRPTWRACPWGSKDLLLVHCRHARTFTICRKIVCHFIGLWSLAEFHGLQNIIVIMELKGSAVKQKPIIWNWNKNKVSEESKDNFSIWSVVTCLSSEGCHRLQNLPLYLD